MKKVAIFDVDGTIFRSSLLIEITNALIKEGLFPQKTENIFDRLHQLKILFFLKYQVAVKRKATVYKSNIIPLLIIADIFSIEPLTVILFFSAQTEPSNAEPSANSTRPSNDFTAARPGIRNPRVPFCSCPVDAPLAAPVSRLTFTGKSPVKRGFRSALPLSLSLHSRVQ